MNQCQYGWMPDADLTGSFRRRLVIALCCSLFLLLIKTPAHAHGPCHCLSPIPAYPGQRVTVPTSYRVIKVVWNPDPTTLSNEALMLLPDGRFYHPERRTITLFASHKIRRGAKVNVPHGVLPGRYLLVIFDGSEDGTHYTWDVLRVRSRIQMPRTGEPTLFLLLLGVSLVVSGRTLLAMTETIRAKRRRQTI
jgi:hypothetical protein